MQQGDLLHALDNLQQAIPHIKQIIVSATQMLGDTCKSEQLGWLEAAENADNLQQIKTKIATIAAELKNIHASDSGVPVSFYSPKIIPIVTRLEQLSGRTPEL